VDRIELALTECHFSVDAAPLAETPDSSEEKSGIPEWVEAETTRL
jgi:hypothetical protein